MGKKRRLNKLISKWIKSDLPDDCSSVLLLGVTRTPPSPKTKRRPFSLPLAIGVVSGCSKTQVRRNSSSASNGRRPSVSRRDSRRGLVAKGERSGARPPKSNQEDASEKYGSQRDRVGDINAENGHHPPAKNCEFTVNRSCYVNDVETNDHEGQNKQISVCKTIKSKEYENDRLSSDQSPDNIDLKVTSAVKPDKEIRSKFNFIRKKIKQERLAFLAYGNNSPEKSPIASRVKVTVSSQTVLKRDPICNTVYKFDNFLPDKSTASCFPAVLPTNKTIPSITFEFPVSLTPLPVGTSPSSFTRLGDGTSTINMETSVDSIGTCSLDMEASAELPSDWSEVSSTGTLRSARILTPSVDQHQPQHLPSYLSLACTVNGYSTTTNYDPVRLARSRDASPHRIDSGNHVTGNQTTYSIKNNLLSPPNLVPLPTPKVTMTENILRTHHHQEFYSSTKTMTFLSSKESQFSSHIFSKDSTDGCSDNTHRTIQRKCVSYESKNLSSLNDQSKCTIESSTINKEFTNGKETKSFIQQRVERLYGPGALAQGFFVSKRQKDRLSESDESGKVHDVDFKPNKTLPDKLSDEENIEPTMKQSSSSPALPVLRHLRPEFRAQLPIASSKKFTESCMQKSVTVPKLKDEVKVNGHLKENEKSASDTPLTNHKLNGNFKDLPIKEESCEKDGHYFIRILDEQAARLLILADKWEQELETPGLSEDVIGKIRSVTGKARLLVSQKMQQFRGLCTNNVTQTVGEAFPTTNADLQGFWDMVMLQVDQVDRLFEEMKTLKENNWNEVAVIKVENKTNTNAKTRKLITKPKISAANEEARKQREEQRKKMIEERRKAMKAAQQSSTPNIEIFVPESS